MGDMAEGFKALREHRRDEREKLGVPCPGCIKHHPKRNPTVLMPGWRCKVCGHADPRPRDPFV